jgi:hypothetical protein
MDGLTSFAGAWSFFSESTRKVLIDVGIGIGGVAVAAVAGIGICHAIPSCKSKYLTSTTTPIATSANISTNPVNASGNTSPKPAITSSTSVNSTLNQKSNTSATQGGRRTHSRHTKRAHQNSKKTRRSRK